MMEAGRTIAMMITLEGLITH